MEELLLPEDREEAAALQVLKEQLQIKYPDGNIPQVKMDEFVKERKVYRFK